MALAGTAYLETTLILFLHIIGAMASMAGVLGLLVLYGRARSATDLAELRVAVSLIAVFNRAILQPAAGLTGIIGIVLALRFDGKGLFELSKQTWLALALVLWVILMGVSARAARTATTAAAPHDGDDLEAVKERLTSSAASAQIWLCLLLLITLVYLMVFQPFVRS